MRGSICSREFKLDVVQQIASGVRRLAQICREHRLAETVLLRWRQDYEARGAAAFTPREVAAGAVTTEWRFAALERFCSQLAPENAVLKKAVQHLRAHYSLLTMSSHI